MENNKEIRRVSFRPALKRTDENTPSRTIEGYALLFDTPSDGLCFDEIIERGALDGVIEKSDVLAVLNHNVDRGVLARSRNGEGSLTLIVDEVGLLYRFEAPNTALGDELLENLRRGEVCESSFCFTVESDSWDFEQNGRDKRTIHKIAELFDVSPVYSGAYSATTVYTRSRDEQRAAADEKAREELARRSLTEYYAKMRKSF